VTGRNVSFKGNFLGVEVNAVVLVVSTVFEVDVEGLWVVCILGLVFEVVVEGDIEVVVGVWVSGVLVVDSVVVAVANTVVVCVVVSVGRVLSIISFVDCSAAFVIVSDSVLGVEGGFVESDTLLSGVCP